MRFGNHESTPNRGKTLGQHEEWCWVSGWDDPPETRSALIGIPVGSGGGGGTVIPIRDC